MDMKKILNAVDGNSKVEAVESSDMKKFLSIVVEGKNTSTNRLSMAEQMAVQQYTPTASKPITNPVLNVSKDAKPSMVGKYFKQVEEEIAEAQERNKHRAKLIAERAVAKLHTKSKTRIQEYYNVPPTDSKSPIPGRHVSGCQCKEVEEGLKDPKDNPCWKGYKPVGTKKKGGRTVPNCVPKESISEEYPPINVPKGWEAKPQPDGSIRISKIGSMSSAEYKQNMANYKAQNWTPEKIAQHQARTASGQGYTDAEKAANYQQQQQQFGKYADQPIEDVEEDIFGIDNKIKGKIQNVVSDLSDIPGMWDHKAQTFTSDGLDKLTSVLKNNPKYVKYALNLTADDYETEDSKNYLKDYDPMKSQMNPKTGQSWLKDYDPMKSQMNPKTGQSWLKDYDPMKSQLDPKGKSYFEPASESRPKGYDSDGNPQGGGYDEYNNPTKWTVAVNGRHWKSFDNEKEAYRAAASIERKYGKKTSVDRE
jgi:hypothetical protein